MGLKAFSVCVTLVFLVCSFFRSVQGITTLFYHTEIVERQDEYRNDDDYVNYGRVDHYVVYGRHVVLGFPDDYDYFGSNISDSGSVAVFSESVLNANDHHQHVQYLYPPDPYDRLRFGATLDMDSTHIVVGSQNISVYVLVSSCDTCDNWKDLIVKIPHPEGYASWNTAYSQAHRDFGRSLVKINGAYIAVNVNDYDVESGYLYVFKESSVGANDWASDATKIKVEKPVGRWDIFANNFAFDERTLAIARSGLSNYIQQVVGTNDQLFMLRESAPFVGDWSWTNITNPYYELGDDFARNQMAYKGLVLAVSAPDATCCDVSCVGSSGDNWNCGAVYVFVESAENALDWEDNVYRIRPSVHNDEIGFARSVAIWGTSIITFEEDWGNSWGGRLFRYDTTDDTSFDYENHETKLEADVLMVDDFNRPATDEKFGYFLLDMDSYDQPPVLYRTSEATIAFRVEFAFSPDENNEIHGVGLAQYCPGLNRYQPCDCSGFDMFDKWCLTPCANGAPAMSASTMDGFPLFDRCDCSELAMTGKSCDIPCEHGGLSNPDTAFENCDCSGLHYAGVTCQKFCYNGVADDTSLNCNCTLSGATGKFCTVDVNDCESSPCMNAGVCSDLGLDLFPYHANEFNCSCDGTGYHGPTCEISDCASSPCSHNGACEQAYTLGVPTGIQCNCSHTGYEGNFCLTEVDECASSPCQNNGVCIDLLGNYRCDCAGTGFEDATCSSDVDDCVSSPCQNSGVCQDKGVNNFQCTCDSFWEGSTCEDNVDDCFLTEKECLNGGDCTDDPVNLGDVICDCSTSAGGFTGKYCDVPIEDACVTFNPCYHGGKCILDDITKEMSCDCSDTGYDGNVCDVEVYASECVSSPCLNGGQCYDPSASSDDWYCVCTNGYAGDTCNITPCDSMPCENEGTCINDDVGGYTCACVVNYSGAQCQVNEDEQVQGGSSSSSNALSDGPDDETSAAENGNANKDDYTLVIIIVVIAIIIPCAIGGFFFYKQQQSKTSYTMPT